MILQPPPIPDSLFGTPESIIKSVPWILWLNELGGTRINAHTQVWDMALASGPITIAGVGFMPAVCIVIAYGGTGGAGNFIGASWGITVGNAIVACVYSVTATNAGQWNGAAGTLGRLLQAAGAFVDCNLTTFQPDGAEIYFTKVGLPVGSSTWNFIFFR
jgi:hypothetical protein